MILAELFFTSYIVVKSLITMWKRILIILLLDFILLGFWAYSIHPCPSISIVLIYILPILFIGNLLAGFLFFLFCRFVFKKRNKYPLFFAINSLFSPVLFYIMFVYLSDQEVAQGLKSYSFFANNQKYILYFDVVGSGFVDGERFNINEVVPSGENGILVGKYYRVKDTVFLDNDTSLHGFLPKLAYEPFKMKMFDQKLTGFPLFQSEIKLIR